MWWVFLWRIYIRKSRSCFSLKENPEGDSLLHTLPENAVRIFRHVTIKIECRRHPALESCMKYKLLLLAMLAAAILSGCAKKLPYDSTADVFLIGDTHVTTGMTNALFYAFEEQQNEQNQPLYGEQFWGMKCFENPDITYGEYEKEYIFYENIMNMFCLSKLWYGSNTLSAEEMEAVSGCAADYMAHLDQETIDFLGITQSDALALCEACYSALLMQQELSARTSVVISEEEIRVITVSEAYFETESAAEAYIAGLDEGQDADSLAASAKKYLTENLTKDEIENTAFRDAIFSVKEGMHTDVISTEDGYLVAILTDAFQDDLSEKRRQELLLERRQECFRQACEDYRAGAEIYISEELWQGYVLQMQKLPEGVLNIYDVFAELKVLAESKEEK